MSGRNIIGNRVVLHPADVDDRLRIYDWLARSDIAGTMSGPPIFPERPVPTWDEFQNDYLEHYFNDSAPLLGRCFLIQVDGTPVGQINYNDLEDREKRKRTELDLWMRSRKDCGNGYGVDAITTLCRFLSRAVRCGRIPGADVRPQSASDPCLRESGFQEARFLGHRGQGIVGNV